MLVLVVIVVEVMQRCRDAEMNRERCGEERKDKQPAQLVWRRDEEVSSKGSAVTRIRTWVLAATTRCPNY